MDLSAKVKDFKEKVDKVIQKVLQFDKDEEEINEQELDETLYLLFKIFNTILENPGDGRRKKLKGKKIDELLKRPGAWACLQLGGFQKFGSTLELKNEKFHASHIQVLVDVLYLQLSDEDKKKTKKVDFKENESKMNLDNLPEEALKLIEEAKKRELEMEQAVEEEKRKKKEEMKKKIEDAKKKMEELEKEKKLKGEDEEDKPYEFQYIQVNRPVDGDSPNILTSREKKYISDFVKELGAVLYDNEDNQKVFQTLKLLKSIIKNSTNLNEKYRTVNPSNKKIQEFILQPEGGKEILKFLEFEFNGHENIYIIEKGKMSERSAQLLTEKLDNLIENPKWTEKKAEISKKRREKKAQDEERKKAEAKILEEKKKEQAKEIYDRSFLVELNKHLSPVLTNGKFTEQILEFLSRILQNTLKEEDKYRHLKLSNDKMHKIVVEPKGVLELLKFLGFKENSGELLLEKNLLSSHQIELIEKEFKSIVVSQKWNSVSTVPPTVKNESKKETKKVNDEVKPTVSKPTKEKEIPKVTKVETVEVKPTVTKTQNSPSENFPKESFKQKPKEEKKKGFLAGLFSWASPENNLDEDEIKK